MTRLNNTRAKLAELGLGAVLITDELNVRYITDFDVQDAYVLLTDKKCYLLTDFRYHEAALASLDEHFEVVTPKSKLDFISEILSSENIKALGFEGENATYAFFNIIASKFEGITLKSVGSLFAELRMIKSKAEIDKLQKAQDIADLAFSQLLGVLTPNMTEIEVAAELEYLMRKAGSEGPSFSTIAVSGDASALPHGVPRNVKLKPGFLTMDFGARHCGYCSDMTRTVVIGKADAEIKKLYNTVLSAQSAALEYLANGGRDAGEADAFARRIIDAEYQGAFGHSLGHGVGLLVHESPALSPRSHGNILVSGNVVTVEPGVYLFGKYGCRIEDMVEICDDGIMNFTHSTKDLIEIF